MKPITPAQLLRLRDKMRCLIEATEANVKVTLKRKVSEKEYLQKVRELGLLSEHFDYALEKLGMEWICNFYQKAYFQWRHDVRWLHRFLQKRPVL